MKKITLFVFLGLIIIGSFFYFYKNSKSGDIEYVEYAQNSGCNRAPGYYNITDPRTDFVDEAKKDYIKNAGISSNYFDEHFKFNCAAENEEEKSVIFEYKIGDYSMDLKLNSSKHNKSGFNIVGNNNFLTIKNVLSKEQALKKLYKCLGEQSMKVDVNYNSRGSKLYMYGINGPSEMGSYGPYNARLDLETGECLKSTAQVQLPAF